MARNLFPYVVAGALGAATLLGGSAKAADAPSSPPVPCNGVMYKDAAGDQRIAPIGGSDADAGYGTTGPANLDLREFFWNYAAGADGKKVLTANFVLDDLTTDVPAEARAGEL